MNAFSLIVISVALATAQAGAPTLLSTSYGPPPAVAVTQQVAIAQPVPVGRLIQRVSYTPPVLSTPIAPAYAIPAPQFHVNQPQYFAQPVVQQIAIPQQIAVHQQQIAVHQQHIAVPQQIAVHQQQVAVAPAYTRLISQPQLVSSQPILQQFAAPAPVAVQHVASAAPHVQHVISQPQQFVAQPVVQHFAAAQPVQQFIAQPQPQLLAQPVVQHIAAPAPVAYQQFAHAPQQVIAQHQLVQQFVAAPQQVVTQEIAHHHVAAPIATDGGYIVKKK